MTLIPKRSNLRAHLAMICVVALMLVTLPAPRAEAAAISVEVDIVFPSILILICHTDLTVTITSPVLGSVFGLASGDESLDAGADAAVATLAGSDLDVDFAIGAPDTDLPSGDPSAVGLVLNNLCGIRAVSNNGLDVSVSASVIAAGAQLTGGVDGTIDISQTPGDTTVRVDAGAFAAPATFAPDGLGTVHDVDVRLLLDISNADEADTYSTAGAQDSFTVTAVLL